MTTLGLPGGASPPLAGKGAGGEEACAPHQAPSCMGGIDAHFSEKENRPGSLHTSRRRGVCGQKQACAPQCAPGCFLMLTPQNLPCPPGRGMNWMSLNYQPDDDSGEREKPTAWPWGQGVTFHDLSYSEITCAAFKSQ